MGNACSQVTYAKWRADRQAMLPQDQQIARANSGLYAIWGSIAICRIGAFVDSITTFFRASPSSALLTTRFAVEGVRHTVLQVGIALGSAASIAEMIITSVLFGRHVHRHWRIGDQLDEYGDRRKIFVSYVKAACDAGPDAKERSVEGVIRPDSVVQEVAGHCRSVGGAPVSEGKWSMVDLATGYLGYETAKLDRRNTTHTVKHASVMFARDGIMQGGAVSCNLALLWNTFKVSDLLHLAAAPINATATAIGGFAFSMACGALHIVAGGLRWHDGVKKLAAASGALAAIDRAQKALEASEQQQHAEQLKAAGIAAALLMHAKRNEEKAANDAEYQIRVGKWRIGYGVTSMVIGGLSLGLFLLVGGMSTGGILLAAAGAAVLVGWAFYAAYRNENDARSIQAAIDSANASVMGAEDGASQETSVLTLDQAIEQAVQLLIKPVKLEKTEKLQDPRSNARRLIKKTLIDIGMKPKYLRPLGFCGSDPAVREPLIEDLKIKIRNLVDGDGVRRAAVKNPAPRAEGKAAACSSPVVAS